MSVFGDDDPEDAWTASDTIPELLANLDLRMRWLVAHLGELDDMHVAAWVLRFRLHLYFIRGRVVDAVEDVAGGPVPRFDRGTPP